MIALTELWDLPPNRAFLPELVAATDFLAAHIKSDRLVATVTCCAAGLGGCSLREIAANEPRHVLPFVRKMFAFENVTACCDDGLGVIQLTVDAQEVVATLVKLIRPGMRGCS